MAIAIYPSLISSNLLRLEATISELTNYCAGFHIDIMDNHFVPNLTWGAQFANIIDKGTPHPSWIHLMVTDSVSIIQRLEVKEKSIISVHFEAVTEMNEILSAIRQRGWQMSLALRPHTPVSLVYPWCTAIDQVLLMSVNPGFSGQSFLPDTLERITDLTRYRAEQNLSFRIGVDGGVTVRIIEQLTKLGVDDAGVAQAIFGASNPVQVLQELAAAASR